MIVTNNISIIDLPIEVIHVLFSKWIIENEDHIKQYNNKDKNNRLEYCQLGGQNFENNHYK